MRIVIIGAGISGLSSAYELATAGHQVTVIDRYGPAAMASGWTLAGVRQSGRDPAEIPLAKAAVAIWAGLADRLGAPTHYRREGNLRLARTPEEASHIRQLVEEQAAGGLDITLLEGAALRAKAPAIAEDVLCASFCASDGHADPQAVIAAFLAAAERAGAATRFGIRALAIETAGDRVTGVRTSDGTLPADRVILAAGIFGNELLGPLGLHVPLDVQLVTALRSIPVEPILAQVVGVANADCAGRQEVTGRFRYTSGIIPWDGAYRDDTGRPVVAPPAEMIAETIRLFGGVVPAALKAPIESIWAGLVDLTPDALPVIDAPARSGMGPEGLVVAMGFSGHGFCLGPVTGQLCRDLATDVTPDLPIEPFGLRRFAGWNGETAPLTLHG